jgi:hypothetical protein
MPAAAKISACHHLCARHQNLEAAGAAGGKDDRRLFQSATFKAKRKSLWQKTASDYGASLGRAA